MRDRFKFRFWNGREIIYDDLPNLKLYNSNDYTWMQCTGMEDDYGKLIYEGDIVEIWKMKGNIQKKMIVKWRDTQCSFRLYDLSAMGATPQKIVSPEKRSMGAVTSIKIIGNIYENPELLEVEE